MLSIAPRNDMKGVVFEVNKLEAREILIAELKKFRSRSYKELTELIGQTWIKQVTGQSQSEYQVEIEVHWDSQENGDLRVYGAIDDGNMKSTIWPLGDDFIMTCDGKVIDKKVKSQKKRS